MIAPVAAALNGVLTVTVDTLITALTVLVSPLILIIDPMLNGGTIVFPVA